MKTMAGLAGLVVALALPAAALGATSPWTLSPIDAGSAIPSPVYLQHAPIDAGSAVPNPAAVATMDRLSPIDAGSDVPNPVYYSPRTYTPPASVPVAAPVAPVVEPTPAGGFDWGDALIGAGVALGIVALLGLAGIEIRHHGRLAHGH